MTKELLSTETIKCSGKKNIGKPDKYPLLDKPVKVLIKHFRDRTKRICCPYIDGYTGEPDDKPTCNAGPGKKKTYYNCGRDGGLTYTEHRLPLCPKVKEGDEASSYEAIDRTEDDALWDEDGD